MIDRRRFVAAAGLGLTAPLVLRAQARAAEPPLRLRYPLAGSTNLQRSVLQPWADIVQARSGGQIAIDIAAAGAPGAVPSTLQEMFRGGEADIVFTKLADNPGRFARLEVFELPFMAARRGLANAQAVQEFAVRHAAEEFADLAPLLVFGEDHGLLHGSKEVASLAALKGSRIAPATRLGGWAFEALGAMPVFVPAPQVAEALKQNVVDACMAAWGAAADMELGDAAAFHTEVPGSPTLAVAVGMLVMERARFDALPPELRRVLAEAGGPQGAEIAGRALDTRSGEIAEAASARKQAISSVPDPEKARWIAATAPVVERWIAEMRGKGIDGQRLLEEARALVAKYDPPVPTAPAPAPQPVQAAPAAPAPTPVPAAAPQAGTLAPPGNVPPGPPAGVLSPPAAAGAAPPAASAPAPQPAAVP